MHVTAVRRAVFLLVAASPAQPHCASASTLTLASTSLLSI